MLSVLCNLRSSALELTLQNFVNLCNQRPPEGIRMYQIRFAPGLRPGPRCWSLRRSPRSPNRMRRGNPLPIPLPLDAFGVSISAPSLLVFAPPTYFWFLRAWTFLMYCNSTLKYRGFRGSTMSSTHRCGNPEPQDFWYPNVHKINV